MNQNTNADFPERSTAPQSQRILSGQFAWLLAMQSCFGLSWSAFLLVPKFLAQEMGLDAGPIGAIVAISGIAVVLTVIPSGILIDRYGRKPWIVLGTLLMSMTGVCFYLAEDPGILLYLGQIFNGLGFAFTFNAAGTLAADLAPRGRTAQAIGLFGAANLAMNAISPTLGEIITEQWGWDYLFVLSTVASLIATLFSLKLQPQTKPPKIIITSSSLTAPLLRVYAGCVGFTASFAVMFVLAQPYALSLNVDQMRPFFLGFTIAALFVRIGLGSLIDKLGAYRASVGSLFFYALTPLVLKYLGPEHLFTIGAVFGLCHGALYPAISTLAIERAGIDKRGMVFSIVHGAFNAGTAFFSLILGQVADIWSYEHAFYAATCITLVATAIVAIRIAPDLGRLG